MEKMFSWNILIRKLSEESCNNADSTYKTIILQNEEKEKIVWQKLKSQAMQ